MEFIRATGVALDSSGAKNVKDEKAAGKPAESTVSVASQGFSLRTWRVFFWLVFLTLLLRYVDYLVGMPLFIFLMMMIEGRQRLITSVLTAGVMGAFYYVLFDLLLHATF